MVYFCIACMLTVIVLVPSTTENLLAPSPLISARYVRGLELEFSKVIYM